MYGVQFPFYKYMCVCVCVCVHIAESLTIVPHNKVYNIYIIFKENLVYVYMYFLIY